MGFGVWFFRGGSPVHVHKYLPQGHRQADEMAQWLKCLLHKHEGLRSDGQHPCKTVAFQSKSVNPVLGRGAMLACQSRGNRKHQLF